MAEEIEEIPEPPEGVVGIPVNELTLEKAQQRHNELATLCDVIDQRKKLAMAEMTALSGWIIGYQARAAEPNRQARRAQPKPKVAKKAPAKKRAKR